MNPLEVIQQNLISSLEAVDNRLEAFSDDLGNKKREELRKGIGGDGNNISPDYSEPYGEYKKTNPLYGLNGIIPDLHESGAFHRAIWYHRDGYGWQARLSNTKDYFKVLADKYNEPADFGPNATKELDIKLLTQIHNDLTKIW